MIYAIIIFVLLLILLSLNIKMSLIIQNNNVAVSINGIKLKPRMKKKEEEVKMKKYKVPVKRVFGFIRKSWPKIRYLLSKASVKLNLNLQYGLSDAAATAILYGSANSVIYGIEPVFKELFKHFSGYYSIKPDFKKEVLDYTLKINLKVKVLHILIFMFKILPVLKNYKKSIKDKGGVVNA